VLVRRDAAGVRLFTRNGIDWSGRFPLIVQAVGALKARSCLIDGEGIAFEDDGLASFELLRGRRHDRQVALCAFDLLELDGRDLRSTPLEDRKRTLARLIGKPRPGIVLNATFEGSGDIVFKHACRSAARASCRVALPLGAFTRLAQSQEPSGAGGEARGGVKHCEQLAQMRGTGFVC
jgi:bifunctional non-homologous end joining protein LigD